MLRGDAVANQRKQFVDRPGPQGAAARLVALAVDQDRRRVTVRHGPEVEVGDPYMGNLVGPGTRVVQE